MPGTSHSSRSALGTAERRMRVRVPVTPPIYIDLEKVNGGLVFNLSEDGLGLSAAKPLGQNGPLGIRIQLPDTDSCIEATGQITWISESRKSAGLRFVSLPEEARQRIRNWIAEENSNCEPLTEPELLPRRLHSPQNQTDATVPVPALPDSADSNIVEEQYTVESALTNVLSPLIDQPAEVVAQVLPQPVQPEPAGSVRAEVCLRASERRTHPRCQIEALSYIRLGRENGGILLNISEGGFAVKAATKVSDGDLATIRIQFTESWDCMEVSGKIAWISESEKKAGIRFVGLTEATRTILNNWLSQEDSPDELRERVVVGPSDSPSDGEIQEIAKNRVFTSGQTPSDSLIQEHQQAADLSSLGATAFDVGKSPATVFGGSSLPWGILKQAETKPKSRFSLFPLSLGDATARMWHLVAAVILADVLALGIVWVASPSAFRYALIEFVAQDGASVGKPVLTKKSLPTNRTTHDPAVQSEHNDSQGNLSESVPAPASSALPKARLAPVPSQVGSVDRPAITPTSKDAVAQNESRLLTSEPSKLPDRSFFATANPPVEAVRTPTGESSPNLPPENTASPSVVTGSALGSLAGPELKRNEIPLPPAKVPVPPVVPARPVVTVSTDPYPAIRFSPKAKSKKLTEGKALQIGRLVSQVDPVYPQDAQRQGLEGTVKLHVVVDRDGKVAKLDPASGPPALMKAAISAVREWRFAQTLLGGQPIETEQDVIVKFRLLRPSNSEN